MSIQQFLRQATQQLTTAGIETARLDVLVLLEDVLGQDRAHLLAHPEQVIAPNQCTILNKKIVRRQKHEPLAYIRGKAMFYGREFSVNRHVLVPRPETESLVDLLKKIHLPDPVYIADIGTGSGCLGITAALELPGCTADLYDVSTSALAIAKRNAQSHAIKAHCYTQNLLEHIHGHYDAVLANLPYVPDNLPINQAAAFEPQKALFAGPDGLKLYRTLWQQLAPTDVRYIITESFPSQHHALALLARHAGYQLERTAVFGQLFSRCI
ncbi:MAG TPA: HemK/PrmC family methyltransferase [Nevskiaceae bacterium]|nr:HemK/PrmC family methyltransferase [Nevskiaceae bacterium]